MITVLPVIEPSIQENCVASVDEEDDDENEEDDEESEEDDDSDYESASSKKSKKKSIGLPYMNMVLILLVEMPQQDTKWN